MDNTCKKIARKTHDVTGWLCYTPVGVSLQPSAFSSSHSQSNWYRTCGYLKSSSIWWLPSSMLVFLRYKSSCIPGSEVREGRKTKLRMKTEPLTAGRDVRQSCCLLGIHRGTENYVLGRWDCYGGWGWCFSLMNFFWKKNLWIKSSLICVDSTNKWIWI